VSSATYYKWKSKYGGMEASDIERLKDLEAENRKLKQMFADLSLENMALKEVIEKNSKAGSAKTARHAHDQRVRVERSQGLCCSRRQPELLRVQATSTRRQCCHRRLD
jgi:hypothetical protein